jgi:hypothetical protein
MRDSQSFGMLTKRENRGVRNMGIGAVCAQHSMSLYMETATKRPHTCSIVCSTVTELVKEKKPGPNSECNTIHTCPSCQGRKLISSLRATHTYE